MTVKRVINILILFLSLLLLIGCRGDLAANEEGIKVFGFIEGRDYTIASALGGRVVEVVADQGERVEAGQILMRLDRTALDLAYAVAKAGVVVAETALTSLESQPEPEDLAAAQASLDAAEAALNGAEAALDLLRESYKPFKPPEVELHAAESAVEVARAGVDLARAELEQVDAGPFEGEIEIARAAVEEAKANLRLVEHQLAELSLKAPVSGIMDQILVKVGELAAPGATVGTVLDPSILSLIVYVPETQVAKLSAGDAVEIRVDAYPDEVFTGRVSHIADQAQFTPTEVQTQEERVKLVFAVEILLDDPDGRLKPGMPADAIITP